MYHPIQLHPFSGSSTAHNHNIDRRKRPKLRKPNSRAAQLLVASRSSTASLKTKSPIRPKEATATRAPDTRAVLSQTGQASRLLPAPPSPSRTQDGSVSSSHPGSSHHAPDAKRSFVLLQWCWPHCSAVSLLSTRPSFAFLASYLYHSFSSLSRCYPFCPFRLPSSFLLPLSLYCHGANFPPLPTLHNLGLLVYVFFVRLVFVRISKVTQPHSFNQVSARLDIEQSRSQAIVMLSGQSASRFV